MVPFKHILVALDFGEPSKRALEVAIEIVKRFDASLSLVHTWEVPVYAYGHAYGGMALSATDLLAPVQEAAQRQLDLALADVQKQIPAARAILKQGAPWREILATIEEIKPDLVVMGTHGRRGLARAVFGSVAEKIVRTSPVPVLTMAGEAGDAPSSDVPPAAPAR
jgi:nucleotide-binding universal stress UspA family protein